MGRDPFDRREDGLFGAALRTWGRPAEADAGARPGLPSDERERLREYQREDRELRRSNEILKKASAFFAAELDAHRGDGSVHRPAS